MRSKYADLRGATQAVIEEWRQTLDGKLALQGAVSLSDQVLISVTHFVTGIVLARHLPAADFGAYVLAFSTLLFFSGVQAALISTPLTLLAAPLAGEALRAHVTTTVLAQAGLGALCSATSFGFMALAAILAPGSGLAPALAGLAVALPFVLAQELCRRVLFVRLLPGRVLANDLVDCGLRIALVLLLLRLDSGAGAGAVWLTPRNVFLAMAGSSLVATLIGLWQFRDLLTAGFRSTMGDVLEKSWALARWGLGSQVGNVLMLQANRFIAAAFTGTAGVALLEAPRLLVAPLQTIATGAGNLTLPRAARCYAQAGTDGMLRFLRPVAVVWAASFVLYTAVLAVAPSFWLRLAYSGKYAGGTGILLIWCLTNAVMGFRMLPGTSLKVMRRLDLAMVAGLLAGGCVVIASVVLCALLGPAGAAAAKLVGEIVLVTSTAVLLVRELRHDSPPTVDASPAPDSRLDR